MKKLRLGVIRWLRIWDGQDCLQRKPRLLRGVTKHYSEHKYDHYSDEEHYEVCWCPKPFETQDYDKLSPEEEYEPMWCPQVVFHQKRHQRPQQKTHEVNDKWKYQRGGMQRVTFSIGVTRRRIAATKGTQTAEHVLLRRTSQHT